MMAAPTERPWSVGRLGESLWIEGPAGSAGSDRFPADRRIVCDLHLTGNPEDDAIAEENAQFIVKTINGAEVA